MRTLNSVNKQTLIEYEDLLFMFVEEEAKFDASKLYYVDAIIINSSEVKLFEKVFNETRKHYDPEIYLKPIFAVNYENLSPMMVACCDGTTDLTQYQVVAQTTRLIKERVERLYLQQKFPSTEFGAMYKTLQYLYARDIDLVPIPLRMSRISYFFPFLSRQFEDEDAGKILDILRLAKQDGYLNDEDAVDKVHLCGNCHSAHHNIRETCSSCGSIDLKVEDLIHHFQCAYIGPESDFTQEYSDDLICPKCQKILRHIGVDYDKPSHIYGCNSCNDFFQNPVFTYLCIDCQDVNEVRHLQEYNIRKMLLTSKGKHLVLSGLPRKSYDQGRGEEEITGVYSYEVFQHILRQEQARAARNNSQSFFGKVKLIDPQLNKLSWRETKMLQNEINKVLKSYLKEYDMVASNNPGDYYYLMTETTEAQAQEIRGVIIYNLEYLVKSNIEDSQIKVEVELTQLRAETDVTS
ncbi:MAG: hypothetical protein AAF985_22155 [Bacteroidota bacterium]